jgi:hypothetical protein
LPNSPTEGADSIVGTNANDLIDGLGGNDTIGGLDGNDTLIGGSGNDVLFGGSGIDSMTGGTGDDVYWVDSPGDVVVELSGGGSDQVATTFATYSLPAEVERLAYSGTDLPPAGPAVITRVCRFDIRAAPPAQARRV